MSYRINRTDGELLIDLQMVLLIILFTDITLIGKIIKVFANTLMKILLSY